MLPSSGQVCQKHEHASETTENTINKGKPLFGNIDFIKVDDCQCTLGSSVIVYLSLLCGL